MIFNTSARLGIAGDFAKATPTLALASPATALPGGKRPQKPKKPTCLGEALEKTEARFAKLKRVLGALNMVRIYNLLIL